MASKPGRLSRPLEPEMPSSALDSETVSQLAKPYQKLGAKPRRLRRPFRAMQ
jgi:hypothetical protein